MYLWSAFLGISCKFSLGGLADIKCPTNGKCIPRRAEDEKNANFLFQTMNKFGCI